MSAQKIADNPTVRHPTPNTKLLRQHAWRQQRVAQRTRSKEVPTATNERRVAAVADRFLLREFNGDPIDPIPAVLRICMIGRRWCSINRSVSGKLNWQLVANKQCYEYGWYVPISGGVQADNSWRVEEQRGSMGINLGKAANSWQLWLFCFFSSVGQSTRPNSIGN